MADADSFSLARPLVWRWRLFALLLILFLAGLRVVYFITNCPLDLAPDEAHYWDWSRHLDLSYYSKGPLVAYLIHAGCALAGGLSQQLIANEMLGVRLPAILCGSLLLLSLYVLTVQVYGSDRLALAVVALAVTIPVVAAGSSLMTIDAPYTCCWGWALVLGHRAIFRGAKWAWPLAGLVVGLGILAKYTMLLWLPAAGLFLLTTPAYRRLLFRPGFWVLSGIAGLCCLPILIWNAQHGWASFQHVGGQAGVIETPGIRWLGPLTYVGMQCGLLLIFWFICWVRAMWAHAPWREVDPGVRYLWWMSALMFAVFFGFSIKADEEPNWPVTAYISGLVLMTAWLAGELRSPRLWYRRAALASLAVTCAAGLAITVAMHHTDWLMPVLARLVGPATAAKPLPIRQIDPTCRLRGFRTLAEEVDRLRDEVARQDGTEPLVTAACWVLPGELGFYCKGHPTVYSLGLGVGDRRSQYDLWRPNPIFDEDEFRGRTMIYVGDFDPLLKGAFEHVDDPKRVVYVENGQPLAAWNVIVCRGYRGFPNLKQAWWWELLAH